VKSAITTAVRNISYEYNPNVRNVKSVIQWYGTYEVPDFQIVIHANRKPVGDHAGRYKFSITNEVAVVLVNQNTAGIEIF